MDTEIIFLLKILSQNQPVYQMKLKMFEVYSLKIIMFKNLVCIDISINIDFRADVFQFKLALDT